MLKWISEAEDLPAIAQDVLIASLDIYRKFWHIQTACLLVRHEDVVPHPIKTTDDMPTDFFWDVGHHILLNGNKWWAALDKIELPPGAKHEHIRGYDCITSVSDSEES